MMAISKVSHRVTGRSIAGFRYFQDLLGCAMAAAPVSIHTAIIASSPLSTMEPDVRDLRAVALIGGVVNDKETSALST
jgi:hypothetical protein